MEVHHKHHIPKKWSEYITEFIMLFSAVTLGFFAENMRESYIERHREKEYMESLLSDLKKDTAEYRNATRYIDRQIKGIDSTLQLLIKENWTKEEIKKLYLINLRILGNRGSEVNTSTSAQLKNAGGLRVIKSNEIINLLSEYWFRNEFVEKYNNIVGDLKLKARDQSYRIYNVFNYTGSNYLQSTRPNKESVDSETITTQNLETDVVDGATLLTKDRLTIIEFANRLSHIRNSMQMVQRKVFQQQNEVATKNDKYYSARCGQIVLPRLPQSYFGPFLLSAQMECLAVKTVDLLGNK